MKYGLLIADTASPMDRVRAVTSERARVFGVYPSSSMASRTAWRVCGSTGRVSLSTCETVAMDTPAR